MPQTQAAWARAYLAVQAIAGVTWWITVAVSDRIQEWTLGGWSPAVVAGPDLVLFAGASALIAWRPFRTAAWVLIGWTTAITIALGLYALIERRAGWGAFIMVIAWVSTLASGLTVVRGDLPVSWFFLGPFRFRQAAEARAAKHLFNSVAQLIVFWTFFLVAVPLALSWIEHRIRIDAAWIDRSAFAPTGIIIFLVASGLGAWSCATMALRGDGTPLPAATARRLVISGPYNYVRNPMAVAGAAQTIGVALWIGSWTAIVSAFAGGLIWNVVIRPNEEADLAARFGTDYERYRQNVRCWRPRLRSWPG